MGPKGTRAVRVDESGQSATGRVSRPRAGVVRRRRPTPARARSWSRTLTPGSRARSPVTRQPRRLEYSSGGSRSRPGTTSTTRAKNSSWSSIGIRWNVTQRSQATAFGTTGGPSGSPGHAVRNSVGDAAQLVAGVAEVLALDDLVAGEDRHRELARRDHQRVRVVLRRDAGHHDRLLEADLADPVAACTPATRRRAPRRRPRCP